MYGGGHWTGKNNPKAKAVIVNNRHFNTIKEAVAFLNISSITVSRRAKILIIGMLN